MSANLVPVRSEADILPVYRATPVGDLLRCQNLGGKVPTPDAPVLLVARCFEERSALAIPPGFAIELRTAAANLKRDPFKVSWAVGVAGIRAIALIGHAGCGMVGLREHRDAFVARLIEQAGWESSAAEQHFDHWSDLFEVDDPAGFVLEESKRLRRRYPKILIAPLLRDGSTGALSQVTDQAL